MFGCIWKQRHKASLLDSTAQTTLMFSTSPRFAARLDFATIGNVFPQEAVGIFVINFANVIVTKLTNFAAGTAVAPTLAPMARRRGASTCPAAMTMTGRASFGTSLHKFSPSIRRDGLPDLRDSHLHLRYLTSWR